MFKDALARRRCLVPADAFYEWKVIEGGKQPYAIARQDGHPLAFAGLWESFRWPDETVTRSFTILTTTPNAEMAELHDRMLVILEQQDWPMWLGEVEGDYVALLRPAAEGLLRVWPVDRRVGSPKKPRAGIADGDRCLGPGDVTSSGHASEETDTICSL